MVPGHFNHYFPSILKINCVWKTFCDDFGLKQLFSHIPLLRVVWAETIICPKISGMEMSFLAECLPMSGITKTMIKVFESP